MSLLIRGTIPLRANHAKVYTEGCIQQFMHLVCANLGGGIHEEEVLSHLGEEEGLVGARVGHLEDLDLGRQMVIAIMMHYTRQ